MPTREQILSTEYSEEFDKIRKNMMVMSYYKYGPIKENAYSGMTDFMKSLELRWETFKETRNTEFLADVANMCMMIFMHPEPYGAKYESTDSDESPGIVGISTEELKREMSDEYLG